MDCGMKSSPRQVDLAGVTPGKGSCVVEAGCRTLIGERGKQSGMFWSEPGAEKVHTFGCIQASRRLDRFWNHRLISCVAENDSLPLAA